MCGAVSLARVSIAHSQLMNGARVQSYTTFTYSNGTNAGVFAAPAVMKTSDFQRFQGDQVDTPFSSYRILVNNTGVRGGATSVLGFVQSSQPGSPKRKLFAFSKVYLEPGTSAEVTLDAPARAVASVGSDGSTRILAGVYKMLIADTLVFTHEITGGRPTLLERPPTSTV